MHAALDSHGLVSSARQRRNKAERTKLSQAGRPDDLWYADFISTVLAGRRFGVTEVDDAIWLLHAL